MTEQEVRGLCLKSREIFLQQPILLELEAPLKICGDIHGQYSDLLRLFEYGGFPPQANYLFLGDYVDRGEKATRYSFSIILVIPFYSILGKQSLETICLLLAYKIKYPENFFLLRGNHECASINRIYGNFNEEPIDWEIRLAILLFSFFFQSEIGIFHLRAHAQAISVCVSIGFYDECKRRYNVKLWKTFTDCFNCLPIAAIIDEKIFCCHGGLSPDLHVRFKKRSNR